MAGINLYLLSLLRVGSERRRMSEMKKVTAQQLEAVLTEEQWGRVVEAARPAIAFVMEWMKREPQFRRMMRKRMARDRKSARILARQIARAEHHIRARPLLRNGKAWR